MIFDSGITDIDLVTYNSKYISLIEDLANSFPNKIGYYFKGKFFSSIDKIESIVKEIPSIQKTIICNYDKNCKDDYLNISNSI